MSNTYAQAYSEVLEILKYFPKDQYEKIPKEKIDFFELNKDKNHYFRVNPNLELIQQNISKKAKAIFLVLFNDYFATENQKNILNRMLKENTEKSENIKSQKYNYDSLFVNQTNNMQITNINDSKTSIFTKIKSFILKILGK